MTEETDENPLCPKCTQPLSIDAVDTYMLEGAVYVQRQFCCHDCEWYFGLWLSGNPPDSALTSAHLTGPTTTEVIS